MFFGVRALNQLVQLNLNTIYPIVWHRGPTFYPSEIAKRETQLEQPALKIAPRHPVGARILTKAWNCRVPSSKSSSRFE